MFTVITKLGQDYRKSELGSPSRGRLSQVKFTESSPAGTEKGAVLSFFFFFFANADAKFIRDTAR